MAAFAAENVLCLEPRLTKHWRLPWRPYIHLVGVRAEGPRVSVGRPYPSVLCQAFTPQALASIDLEVVTSLTQHG